MSVTPGAIRFNTDSMKLEYYRGGPVGFGTTTITGEWVQITTDTPDIQTGGTRGVFGAGINPGALQTTDYVNVSSTGDAINFGDLSYVNHYPFACSSSTRGLFAGGYTNPASVNTIEKVEIATTANATDFGDLTGQRSHGAATSDSHGGLG